MASKLATLEYLPDISGPLTVHILSVWYLVNTTLSPGFILARVVRVKNENGRKFTRKKLWRRVGLRILNSNTGVALRILHYYICVVN